MIGRAKTFARAGSEQSAVSGKGNSINKVKVSVES